MSVKPSARAPSRMVLLCCVQLSHERRPDRCYLARTSSLARACPCRTQAPLANLTTCWCRCRAAVQRTIRSPKDARSPARWRAFVETAAAVALLLRRRRVVVRCSCQGDSAAPSLTLVLTKQASGGMNELSPLNLDLVVLETVPPFLRAVRRRMQPGGMLADADAAPIHFLTYMCSSQSTISDASWRHCPVFLPFLLTQFEQIFRCLRASSLPTRCFIQRSNVFFDSPCRRQYSVRFNSLRRHASTCSGQ